ncbi:PREDICTED: seipin isoform X2 [Nicrophorus vespilloides]|uniref:Seipin n=1 Tax=Nicrophorus vespilloides TaxID=110193 RepID=A0ABM1N093_NICVS|nr:PREDICTED: seipin isoform X2 [Nicrophorus vespilloides]
MFGIFSLLVQFFRLGPKEFYKVRFKLPAIRFIDNTLDVLRAKSKTGIYNTKEVFIKGTVVAFITTVLVWLSVFMYLAFYYTYVPSVAHERPVHLKFTPRDNIANYKENGPHSYLNAHVELTNRQQLLMMGQPYKVFLDLEMPESPVNKELGMFMVCTQFHGKKSLIAQSCRSAMLEYRSPLLQFLYTIVYSPFFLFGAAQEKQKLHIELFSNYEEQTGPAVTDVYIEIQSMYIELYSAKFLINAEFTGLRYFMFNWPVLSAIIGITSNLFFIAIVGIISWYQLIHSEEYRKYIRSKDNIQDKFQGSMEDSYSSSSIEDISGKELKFGEEYINKME